LKVLLGSVVGAVALVILEAAYFVTQWLMYDGRTWVTASCAPRSVTRRQEGDHEQAGALALLLPRGGDHLRDRGSGAKAPTLLLLALPTSRGPVLPAVDPRNQTLHDKLAKTIVVVAPDVAVGVATSDTTNRFDEATGRRRSHDPSRNAPRVAAS